MSKKKNISSSVEEAKCSLELYNKLMNAMRDLTYNEMEQVMVLLADYVDLLERNQLLDRRIALVNAECTCSVFEYLYRAGQLKVDKVGFDPEVRKRLYDVLITIADKYEAD